VFVIEACYSIYQLKVLVRWRKQLKCNNSTISEKQQGEIKMGENPVKTTFYSQIEVSNRILMAFYVIPRQFLCTKAELNVV
jgi:hypothetical protein